MQFAAKARTVTQSSKKSVFARSTWPAFPFFTPYSADPHLRRIEAV